MARINFGLLCRAKVCLLGLLISRIRLSVLYIRFYSQAHLLQDRMSSKGLEDERDTVRAADAESQRDRLHYSSEGYSREYGLKCDLSMF